MRMLSFNLSKAVAAMSALSALFYVAMIVSLLISDGSGSIKVAGTFILGIPILMALIIYLQNRLTKALEAQVKVLEAQEPVI